MASRKKTLSAFIIALFLVLTTSAAYACTVWVGKFTVSTERDGQPGYFGPYEQVSTYGLGTGMNHCWMEGAIMVDVDGADRSTIRIDYGAIPAPRDPACAAAASRSPKATAYTISYLNTGFGEYVGGNSGEWDVDRVTQREYVHDCMAIGGHRSIWQQSAGGSDFSVSATTGTGTWSGTIADKSDNHPRGQGEINDLPGTESAICIQQAAGTYTGAPDGAQAPIIVI